MRSKLLEQPMREWLAPKALRGAGWRLLFLVLLAMAAAGLVTLRGLPALLLLVLLIEAIAAGWLLAPAPVVVVAAALAAVELLRIFLAPASALEAVVGICAIAAVAYFAHLAATAIGRSRTAGENDRRVHELSFLLDAAQALAETLDRDRILTLAVRSVDQGVSRAGTGRPSHASFHAVKEQEATITVAVDEPAARDQCLGFRYPVERNQAARAALRSGRAAFVRPDHMTGTLLDLALKLDWKVLILAPVFASGSFVGFLAATARDEPAVDRRQLRMLDVLARMTGLALGNAEDLELERAEAARFREVATPQITSQFAQQLREMLAPLQGAEPSAERAQMINRLLATVESRTAVETETGLLRREVGMLALKRDVARAHRTLLGRHCIAYISIRSTDKRAQPDVLRAVATALRQRLRQEDLVFFDTEKDIVCSLSDMDVEAAWPIFNDVRSRLERQFGAPPFSIGLTTLRNDQTAEDAVSAARSAMAPLRQRPQTRRESA